MPSSSFSLESPQATPAELAALIQNILDDDVIDLEAVCPAQPEPEFTVAELAGCYRLAWQLLVTGVDIPSTRRLVLNIAIRGSATPEQAIKFKLMRARFKKMRFACANYSALHAYPEKLHSITKVMGSFQDAYKNGQKIRTLRLGVKLCARLRSGFFAELRETLVQSGLANLDSFERYIAIENQHLAESAQEGTSITAREFHELRKVVSRRIALNDTRRALYPTAQLHAISRFLATINGLMGQMHDELVLKQIRNELDYENQLFKLPDDIARRIRALVLTQRTLEPAVHAR